MQTQEHTRCIYTRIEPNIHKFVFTESSRAAVDEFITTLEKLNTVSEADQTQATHTLMDTTIGVQPIAYMFGRTREMMKRLSENTNTATLPKTKLALMLPPGPLVQGIEIMLRGLPAMRTQIFKPGEEDKALEWLNE